MFRDLHSENSTPPPSEKVVATTPTSTCEPENSLSNGHALVDCNAYFFSYDECAVPDGTAHKNGKWR